MLLYYEYAYLALIMMNTTSMPWKGNQLGTHLHRGRKGVKMALGLRYHQ